MDSLEFDDKGPPFDLELKKSVADDLEVPFVKEKLESSDGTQPCGGTSDDDSGYHLDEYSWIPSGLRPDLVLLYMRSLPETRIPYVGSVGDRYRMVQLLRQLPVQDSNVKYCHGLSDEEKKELSTFAECRRSEALGRGSVRLSNHEGLKCKECGGNIKPGDVSVAALRIDEEDAFFHPRCFICHHCKELLVDLIYFAKDGSVYCGRHHAELIKPRCVACDELIFTDECTEAEGQMWHMKHFTCNDCDAQLGGQRYVMRDNRPICCVCYDASHADRCHSCHLAIGVNQGLTEVNGRRWHATDECFRCHACLESLVGRRFLPKDDALFCSVCSLIGPRFTNPDSPQRIIIGKNVSLDELDVVEPERSGGAHTRGAAASKHSEGRGNEDGVDRSASVNGHHRKSLTLGRNHSIWKDDRGCVGQTGAMYGNGGSSENLELQSEGETPGTRRQVGPQVRSKGASRSKGRSHSAVDDGRRRLSKEEELIEMYQSQSLHRQKRSVFGYDQENQENDDSADFHISRFHDFEFAEDRQRNGVGFDPRMLRMTRGNPRDASEPVELSRGKKSVRFDPSTKASSRTPSPREEESRRRLRNRSSVCGRDVWDDAGRARRPSGGYSSDGGAASRPKRSSGYFSDSASDWSKGGCPYDGGGGSNWSSGGRKTGWSEHRACGQRLRTESGDYDAFEFAEFDDGDNVEKCSTCSSSSDSSDFYETQSVVCHGGHFDSPSFRKSASSYLYSEKHCCRTLPPSSRVSFADAGVKMGKKKKKKMKKHGKTNCVIS